MYHPVTKPTGIDLGVSTFPSFSDGKKIQLPVSLKKAKIKLGKLQYIYRNKQLGNRQSGIQASRNAKKYYRSLAQKHGHIANNRRDFPPTTQTKISQKYDTALGIFEGDLADYQRTII